MDIANYIGQFLLKNQYCYIHGLGNLELKKRPATINNKIIEASGYTITITQNGSIDDAFANFIATNEHISISKAANALRDYSLQARKDLGEGKDVTIPGLGKYVQEKNIITFVTDERFSYKPVGMPVLENSKRIEDLKANVTPNLPLYPPPQKADSLNWTMVILVVVLLIVVGGGGYGIYYYMNQQNQNTIKAPVQPVKPLVDTTAKAQPTISVTDSTHTLNDSTAAGTASLTASQHDTVVNVPVVNNYKFIIGFYDNESRAKRRLNQLLEGHNKVEIEKLDSAKYFIVTNIICKSIDTTHIKDSLMVFFAYKHVRIEQK